MQPKPNSTVETLRQAVQKIRHILQFLTNRGTLTGLLSTMSES